jgi:hypothetical protein
MPLDCASPLWLVLRVGSNPCPFTSTSSADLAARRVTTGSHIPGTERSLAVTSGHAGAEICIQEEHGGYGRTWSDTLPRRFGTLRPRVGFRVRRVVYPVRGTSRHCLPPPAGPSRVPTRTTRWSCALDVPRVCTCVLMPPCMATETRTRGRLRLQSSSRLPRSSG